MQKAAEKGYEALMTAPRADYGDDIRKAFASMDSLLKEMGIEPTVSDFSEWCESVKQIMNNSHEWKVLQQRNLLDWEFNMRAYRIILKYIGINLHESIMANLINKFPQLKKLIDELKLKIDFDYMLKELEE